ncbi:PREDICTED: uncharacterized protein LOC105359448 [Ceratosolen solmsi marchali]|uniref:Uncharacterized protein LOC105359448 n=1 Tax=Ceratosolen solmsi marchali TaxID=326594 RepID=A0AAJ6VL37_9HYME|nr:PREDICTED: uncharacterized protein LOC105359448 [Ceratosolen solmsi marchali]
MVNNYENVEVSEEKQYNNIQEKQREKDIVDTDDSKDDFEYQLSRFLDYPKSRDILTEKDHIEDDFTFEISPDDKDRIKRELEYDSRYLFNVKPAEDVNEGEPTSTETNNLTSIISNEMDKKLELQSIGHIDDFVDMNNTAIYINDTNMSLLEQLTSFLYSFFATIRDITTNIYTLISNTFKV